MLLHRSWLLPFHMPYPEAEKVLMERYSWTDGWLGAKMWLGSGWSLLFQRPTDVRAIFLKDLEMKLGSALTQLWHVIPLPPW